MREGEAPLPDGWLAGDLVTVLREHVADESVDFITGSPFHPVLLRELGLSVAADDFVEWMLEVSGELARVLKRGREMLIFTSLFPWAHPCLSPPCMSRLLKHQYNVDALRQTDWVRFYPGHAAFDAWDGEWGLSAYRTIVFDEFTPQEIRMAFVGFIRADSDARLRGAKVPAHESGDEGTDTFMLIRPFIEACTQPGDLVLFPFENQPDEWMREETRALGRRTLSVLTRPPD